MRCGKTTLSDLLIKYVCQCNPNTKIIYIHHWPIKDVKEASGHFEYLQKQGWALDRDTVCFWWHIGVYHNADLWGCFFKSIHQYKNHHAIILTGYGSPLLRVQVQGTLVQWNAYQRVTLCPIKHNDGLPPVRILFSQEEFNTLICRLYSKTLYDFNSSFFDYVFIITKVHVEVIIAHDVYWAEVMV